MSALSRWRKRANAKGLSKAEKDKDLRRDSNKEAFDEFKAKRAEQQRKRRRRAKQNNSDNIHSDKHNSGKGPRVQFIQVKDGVEVFYVDVEYLQKKGHKVKNKVYADKSAKKLMARLAEKYYSKRKKNMSEFDLLYKTLSKKNRVFGHESEKGHKKVYATIVVT